MKTLSRVMMFQDAYKGGISGIGIAMTICILEVGLPNDFWKLVFIISFGFIAGCLITIASEMVCILTYRLFPKHQGFIWGYLLLSFGVGFAVFYAMGYLGYLFHWEGLSKERIFYESLGVGILSAMLSFYFIYLNEKDERIALEIENSKLVVVEERTRIARELHDSVSQTLFGINLNLNTLKLINSSQPQQATVMIDRLQEMVEEVQAEMRLMIYELQPAALIQKEFFEAVECLIGLFRVRYNLNIVCQLEGETEGLDSGIQLTLYRVLQESLNNVVKHAATKDVVVSIRGASGHVQMAIRDHGNGFESDELNIATHLGIIGMKERLSLVNGSLDIKSSPGNGTLVSAAV